MSARVSTSRRFGTRAQNQFSSEADVMNETLETEPDIDIDLDIRFTASDILRRTTTNESVGR
jgi:hypothetical protein